MPESTDEVAYAAPHIRRLRSTRLAGVGLVAAGVLALCCLLSYHPEQVSWSLLNPTGHEQAAAIPCTNLLGIIGMYLAGLLYYLLGAVAVYGALLMLLPACGMVLRPEEPRRGQWLALAAILLSACAVMAMQPWFFEHWVKTMHTTTAGGVVGYLLGPCVWEAFLGNTWALVLMLAVHGVALIYYAGLTPASLYRTTRDDVKTLWRRRRERRLQALRDKDAAQRAWQRVAPTRPDSSAPPLYTPDLLPPGPAESSTPRYAGDAEPEPRPEPPVARPLPPRVDTRVSPEPEPARPEPPPARPAPEPARPAPEPARPEPPPAEPPRGGMRRPIRRGSPGNLLDLLPEDEDEEEELRRSAPELPPDEEESFLPINSHTLETLYRRRIATNAASPQPESRPAPRPAPRPEPRPVPQPAPRPAPPLSAPEPDSDYPMPPYDLLNYEPPSQELRDAAQEEMQNTQARIIDTLESFRISVEPGAITRGPSITRYEFAVPRGQSVKSVAAKKSDLMAATRSATVNILAPIPGKSTVGIELQNSVAEPVYLRELLMSDEFHNPKLRLPVALGKDVYGKPVIGDLAAMPHLLVAGTTGSGKSVCINSMLISLIYKLRPDELKFILVDPKQVEMQPYRKLPHLAVPVVSDPARVIGALRWAVNEMERRYSYFTKMGVRNLEDFNKLPPDAQPVQDDDIALPPEPENTQLDLRDQYAIERDIEDSQGIEHIPGEDEEPEGESDDVTIPSKLPYVVIIIDELADLMQQVKEDLENCIARLTQKARAAGIHLVVATQTPRSQVVTGTIKTNLPCRVALKVSNLVDSRVILDEGGAENLIGKGDLLFLPPGGTSKMTRAQGAFVTDAEIASIIRFCASHARQCFVQSATSALNDDAASGQASGGRGGRGSDSDASGVDEELYTRCVNLVITERKASTTLLQRRFRIGYGKAAEIMELMEKRGVVAPSNGSSRAREVLIEAP